MGCWLLFPKILEGHQTDLVDAGAVGDINRLGYPNIIKVGMSFYEYHALGAGFENIFQLALQCVPIGFLLVDLNLRIGADRDHDGALIRLVSLLSRRRGLRNQGLQTFRRQGGDHHEDDDQHQQYVDHRRHVDVALDTLGAADCHSHKNAPLKNSDYCFFSAGLASACACSVSKPNWSTPAACKFCTTSSTTEYLARWSDFTKTMWSVRLARRSFTLGARSSGLSCVVFRKVFPSRVTAITIASLLSAACMAM